MIKSAFKEENVRNDLLMEGYEVELLGQAFVSQCRIAGIPALRSPLGSPESEPNPKRPQYRRARPLSVSTPTDVSLNAGAQAMSVQGSTLNASSSGISDSVPSLIGPSGNSNDSAYATSFHTQTSRDSSPSSALMSLGHSVSTHMRPGLGLSVRSGGALAAVPDMGMVVTKTVIPARRVLPDQDDVDMAEVESAETRSSKTASRRRSARSKTAVKPEKLESAPSESGLISEGLQQSSLSSRRDRSVRTRSSRTSRSLRLGSRSSSASSGAAQVVLNVMRQLQEQQAAFKTQLSQAQLDMRLGMQRELQNASFEVRAMKAEVSLTAERELRSPGDEGGSVPRARRAEEADGEMKKRLDSVQQTIQNILLERELEWAERELERNTALNLQKFLADQNRELRATLSQVQSVNATTPPQPATGITADTSVASHSATLNQVSSSAINDGVVPSTGYAHLRNTTEVGAAQLRAIAGTSLPKKETAERDRSSQRTSTVTTLKSSGTKSESAAKVSASSAAKKCAAKKHASRRPSSRRGKEHADPPPSDPDDSDSNSSDSSGDNSSSSAYSSSSSDDFDLDLTTSTTNQGMHDSVDEGYDTLPPRRDFRADNDPQGRFKARRPGRAFVAQGSEPDSSSEFERRVRFEGLDDEAKPAAQVALAKGREKSVTEPAPAETQSVFKVENVTKEIYRVLDAEGWRPPPQFGNADVRSGNPDLRSRPMSPRSSNSPWQRTCENSRRIGHSKENCWADLICDRCHQQGHPTEACRANPCPGCNQLHRGFSCEDWRAIQAMKKITRQGALNDLTLDAPQTGEADSGKKPLNH
ncbi:unnamed protein product [Phytophthora fragariaefolia]|uniref:Unnamed protein product n=1 Tax=Phytophthora fragariaefolia TaxID=1490495 RepID=A0A9W6TJ79_9STRA|nr:unnamed protein product [Phytophthora fragariaefolia]